MIRNSVISGVSFEDTGEEEQYNLIIKILVIDNHQFDYALTVQNQNLTFEVEKDDAQIEEFSYLIPKRFNAHEYDSEWINDSELIITIPSNTNSHGE